MQVEIEPKNDTNLPQPFEMGQEKSITDVFFMGSKQERIEAFQDVLKRIKNNEKLEDQISQFFCNDQDAIFNESDEDLQIQILQIYQTMDLDISGGLQKQQFWHHFISKFLSSSNKNIREESFVLFDDFFSKINKQKFLQFGLSFLQKNNIKINRIVLRTLSKHSEKFNFDECSEQILKAIDKNLSNPSKEIRQRTIDFLKELVKQLGVNVLNQLKKLKEDQKQEILNSGDVKNIQIKEQPNQEELMQQKVDQLKQQDNLYNNSKPSQILSKYPDSWCQKVLNLKKWKEKKAEIQSFFEDAKNVGKLDTSVSCSHFMNLITLLLKENIIMLQFEGLKLIQFLARGLRQNFASKGKKLCKILVGKLIDRKHQVIEYILKTFEALFLVLKLDDIYSYVEIYNKNRNKDARQSVLKLIKIYFDYVFTTKENKLEQFLKLFGKLLNIYYEDKDLEIKQLTNELVLYMRDRLELIKQENLIYKYINKDKIKEQKCKSNISLVHKTDNYQSVINTPNICKSPQRKKSVSKENSGNKKYNYIDMEISIDNAQNFIKETFGEQVLQNCLDGNWKIKRQGLQELVSKLKSSQKKFQDVQTRQICKFMQNITNQFTENNLLLINEIFIIFDVLFEHTDCKESIFYNFVQFYINKVSEKRYQKQLRDHLNLYKGELQFHVILNLFCKNINKQTNSKILLEICNDLQEFVEDQVSFVDNDIVNILSLCLNDNNQQARNKSEELLKILAPNLSQNLEIIIEKIDNKNLQQKLKEEYKLEIQQNKKSIEPKVSIQKPQKQIQRRSSLIQQQEQPKVSLQDCSLQEILSKLEKGDWKQKKEYLQLYKQYVFEHAEMMDHSKANETFEIIDKKLNDSHRAVILEAISITGDFLDRFFQQLKFFHKKIIRDCIKLSLEKSAPLKTEIERIFQIYNQKQYGYMVSQSLLAQIINNNKVLYNSFVSILTDKDKKVRKVGYQIVEEIANVLGKDDIEFRIASERPILREKIKKILRKLFPPEIPQILNSNQKKQRPLLSVDPKMRQSHKSTKSFQIHEFELDSYILFLDSVMNFEEPQDLEISLLHNYLIQILNQDFVRKIFSYQTSTIVEAYDSLQQTNVFTQQNIIAFMELIYIRVYDTCRNLVVNTIAQFLYHLKRVMEDKQIVYNGSKESSVVVNTILRLYINMNYKNSRIMCDFLHLVNNHYVMTYCFKALKQTEAVAVEIKLLDLILETLKNLDKDAYIDEQMIDQLLNLQKVHEQKISFIFQILNQNKYFKDIRSTAKFKDQFKNSSKKNKEMSIQETLYFLSQQNFDAGYLVNNCNEVIPKVIEYSQDMFFNPQDKSGEEFEKILLILNKICSQKQIVDYLSYDNAYGFIQQMIFFLLQIDKQKELYRFTKQNQTLLGSDQIISSLNSSIVKLLDSNNPNNLLSILFKMQEHLRQKITNENEEEANTKYKNILVRLILKLVKTFKKNQQKLQIKDILNLLYQYFIMYKDFKDSIYMKTLKTILNELTILLGSEIFRYYENMEQKSDTDFLTCINKYLDKNAQQSIQKNCTKENVFYYN